MWLYLPRTVSLALPFLIYEIVDASFACGFFVNQPDARAVNVLTYCLFRVMFEQGFCI